MTELNGNSFIVFCSTCANVMKVTLVLRDLGFDAVCLHGQMSQVRRKPTAGLCQFTNGRVPFISLHGRVVWVVSTQTKRLGALAKFTSQSHNILVATDVASRGLDIPHVDVIVNYDIPTHSKVGMGAWGWAGRFDSGPNRCGVWLRQDYIHRVGRTARAGRAGRAITLVTQYDVELFQRIEELIGLRMEQHPVEEAEVLLLLARVTEAQRNATQELKAIDEAQGGRSSVSAAGSRQGARVRRPG
jgi:ATP-dependent RNA helicase DDX47/RRP3